MSDKKFKALLGGIAVTLVAIMALPGQLNDFLLESAILKEKWLSAGQWSGIYSSTPEGIVNVGELALSTESDVVLRLTYVEEGDYFDGDILSESFCPLGVFFYRNLLIGGRSSILTPNRIRLDVFDYVVGRKIALGTLRVKREAPGGLITIRSRELFSEDELRLAPTAALDENDLELHCFNGQSQE